eukprot:8661402-Prorocentrum_lima.AAC.1
MSLRGEVTFDVAAGQRIMHHNIDHRGVIVEIETLCTESCLDQGHDHTAKHTGQIYTWKYIIAAGLTKVLQQE